MHRLLLDANRARLRNAAMPKTTVAKMQHRRGSACIIVRSLKD